MFHKKTEMRVLIDDPNLRGTQHAPRKPIQLKKIAGRVRQIERVAARVRGFLEVHHAEQR